MAQPKNTTDGIRILSLVWYKVLPPKFGGQKGVAFFNEHLGRLVPLVCLCSRNNEVFSSSYTIDASLPVAKTQFFNPFIWWKIFAAAKEHKATHLVLEFPYHAVAGLLCKQLLPVQLIVHEHNIEAYRFKKMGKWWWRILFYLERMALKKADAILFKTEMDRRIAVNAFGIPEEKTVVIPYGVATNQNFDRQQAKKTVYQKHNIPPEKKLLLFAGTLDYGPNADAVKAIEQKLIPQLDGAGLDYIILICGRIVFKSFYYLKEIRNERLIYAGHVEDIETYFAAADIFINPVISGGGVQTKIIDALASGLNVVCFTGMKEGICGADNKFFTAPKDDWQAFSKAVTNGLKETAPTPAHFFDCHDWNNIAAKAVNFIQGC